MNQVRIAIIGGGISGLYAAYLLQSQGISDYVLLEARKRLGGRVLSVGLTGIGEALTDETNRFDLGPSWFWPDYQPQLDNLIAGLGLERFAQPTLGDVLIERAGVSLARKAGYFSSSASVRLLGGMTALVDALAAKVNPDNVRIGQAVRRIHASEHHLQVECESPDGMGESWAVEKGLLAAPPRVLAQDIEPIPALPSSVVQQWRIPRLGWLLTPNTSPFSNPHSGTNPDCPDKHAVQLALWWRFMKSHRQADMLRCSVL